MRRVAAVALALVACAAALALAVQGPPPGAGVPRLVMPPRPGAPGAFTQADAVAAWRWWLGQHPEHHRKHWRSLWWGNRKSERRELLWKLLNGHINGMSRDGRLRPVEIVPGTGGGLWAVNLLWFRWDPAVWEKFADSDIFFNDLGDAYAEPARARAPAVPAGLRVIGDYYYSATPRAGFTNYQASSKDGIDYPQGFYAKRSEIDGDKPAAPEKAVRSKGPAKWVTPSEVHATDFKWLYEHTGSRCPIVSGEFFTWSTGACEGRVPNYYEFLGIKDEQTFFNAVGSERQKDINFGGSILSVVIQSRVATVKFRVVELIPKSRGGELWSTLDVDQVTLNRKLRERDPSSSPTLTLGTDAKGNPLFKHVATEKIGHLANGLCAWYAGDAQGAKQDAVPGTIATNYLAHAQDGRPIQVPGGCYECHDQGGMQPFDDWVRERYPGPPLPALTFPTPEEQIRFEGQYGREFGPALHNSQRRHAAAIWQITGMDTGFWSRQWADEWYRITGMVDLERAAADLCCEPEVLLKAIDAGGAVAPVGKGLVNPGLGGLRPRNDGKPSPGLPLNDWWQLYGEAQRLLREVGH